MEIKRCSSGIVEDKELHVHLTVLALCTPVFEKMFTSEFQEKGKNEFFLPNEWMNECEWSEPVASDSISLCIRKANQPILINDQNCHFLVQLADEYQMKAVVRKCENFIITMVKQYQDCGRMGEKEFSSGVGIFSDVQLTQAEASQHCSGWYF